MEEKSLWKWSKGEKRSREGGLLVVMIGGGLLSLGFVC